MGTNDIFVFLLSSIMLLLIICDNSAKKQHCAKDISSHSAEATAFQQHIAVQEQGAYSLYAGEVNAAIPAAANNSYKQA